MMWQAFLLQLKLAGNLAVGPGWRVGFVELTRLDIPPRTFWGAFTDALGRCSATDNFLCTAIAEEAEVAPDVLTLRHIGVWLARNVRFLPGIPVVKENTDEVERLIPCYHFGSGPAFRKKSTDKWQWMDQGQAMRAFTRCRAGAALAYDTMSTEQGMLHDTERIMPQAARADRLCHHWIETVIFLRQTMAVDLKRWLATSAGRYLRIGRDITYGDGAFDQVLISHIDLAGLLDLRDLANDNDALTWETQHPLGPVLAVTPKTASKSSGYRLRLPGPLILPEIPRELSGYWGEIRPFIVREFDTNGFGTRCGFPDEAPQWLLEHGGILSSSRPVPIQFVLLRDGWHLKKL